MNNLACRAAWVLPQTSQFPICRVIASRRFPNSARSFRSPTHLRAPRDDPTDAAGSSRNHVKDPAVAPQDEDVPTPPPDEVIGNTDAAAEPKRESGEAAPSGGTEVSPEKLTRSKDKGTYGSALRRAGRNVKSVKELPAVTLPTWFLERNVRLFEDVANDRSFRQLRMFDPTKSSPAFVPLDKEKDMPDILRVREMIKLARGGEGAGTKAEDLRPKTEELHLKAEELHTNAGDVPTTTKNSSFETSSKSHDFTAKQASSESPSRPSIFYDINEHVMVEIFTMVSAGLQLPAARYADTHAASKPHILLQCPKDGGITFLNLVARYAALANKADVIIIDAQDIAEVAGEYVGDLSDSPINSVCSLGYDTHLIMARRDQQTTDDELADGEPDEADADDPVQQPASRRYPRHYSNAKAIVMPTITFVGSAKLSEFLSSSKTNNPLTLSNGQSGTSAENASALPPSTEQSSKTKITLLLEAVLDAAHAKRRIQVRSIQSTDADGTNGPPSLLSVDTEAPTQDERSNISRRSFSSPLIVLIKDYAEMNATSSGGPVLDQLHEVVSRRRKEGQRVMIIGTTSSEDLVPSLSESGFKSLQTEPGQGPYRVLVTPCELTSKSIEEGALENDGKLRTCRINVRHLQDMIRKLAPSLEQVSGFISQSTQRLSFSLQMASMTGLTEQVWSFDRVHRTAMMVLGVLQDGEDLSTTHVAKALSILDASDHAKFDWIRRSRDSQKKLRVRSSQQLGESGNAQSNIPESRRQKDLEDRIKKLRGSCNQHEKKLLNGVVDAESIHTTFGDVRAPPETIEALKTITSLSLLRPEAFTYGVLATDKIPGLLLYGPSGTGKTLLAKAVAKESGATVLEVSGSDVYDMYVGESEKNVRAIFSLAKKLTPCIVFIDEADAIFGSRSTHSNRTTHREIINQFLKEWDGMSDSSAFIMVATNRPFDLDDAVLRRLPRRLLVDLPTEKDREAILRIHLQNEVLDSSISLARLASETPFYSGSDLKNLSVAAALICVREENDAARACNGPTPYEYAPKRTLTLRHFEKAMDEISASISEDMSSLSAIRKFDERYGDRKGRKRRSEGYGFGSRTETEKNNPDLVRVRS